MGKTYRRQKREREGKPPSRKRFDVYMKEQTKGSWMNELDKEPELDKETRKKYLKDG